MNDLVVVGGSLAGLNSALHASRKGAKVLVLEKRKEIGKGFATCGEGIAKHLLIKLDLYSSEWVANECNKMHLQLLDLGIRLPPESWF